MNKELLGFLFKVFLLTLTLYFTCEFALQSSNMNTHISIVTLIVVTILVCVTFIIFRCRDNNGETTSSGHGRKDLFDFVLKVFLLTITIYFICDFAEKATTMNTRLSVISVMIIAILVCVLFLFIRTKPSELLSDTTSTIV